MDAQTAEVAELPELLLATIAKLSKLSVKRDEMNDELSCVRSYHAAVATVLDDPKLVAGANERPAKRAKTTRSCNESFTNAFDSDFFGLC